MNFQAMLLQPNKKNMKKLREVLYDLYKHLDSSAAAIIDVSLLLAVGCVFVLCCLYTRNYFLFFLICCCCVFPIPAICHGYSRLEPQPARILSLRVLQNRLQPAGLQIEEQLLTMCPFFCFVSVNKSKLNETVYCRALVRVTPPCMLIHIQRNFSIAIQSMTTGEYLYLPPLVLCLQFFLKNVIVLSYVQVNEIMCFKSFHIPCFVTCSSYI